jgi:hypothetical protein
MNRRLAWWLAAGAVVAGAGVLGVSLNESLRAEPLTKLLHPVISGQDAEQALVASALLDNYVEQRRTAAVWSGVYWGFAWLSAVLSALAGLVLKLESLLADDKVKKDVAATLAVTAALLITISTSGDFHRKWQATRAAATDIEKAAYEFLRNGGKEPRSYLESVGDALYKRHQAILGTGERAPHPSSAASPGKERASP